MKNDESQTKPWPVLQCTDAAVQVFKARYVMKLNTLVQLVQHKLSTALACATAMAFACSLTLVPSVHAQSIVVTVVVGTTPQGVAADPVTNLIFVANQGSNSVSVINGATGAAVGSPISVGSAPTAVAVNPA